MQISHGELDVGKLDVLSHEGNLIAFCFVDLVGEAIREPAATLNATFGEARSAPNLC